MASSLAPIPTPRAAYLLCATPRSGSTLICDMLGATGVAGRPEEYFEVLRETGLPREPREYFAGVTDPGVLACLPPSAAPRPETQPFTRRLAEVIEAGTTLNGVFGAKVMWGYHDDLQARLATVAGLAPLGAADRLRALLGDVRFVHIRRTDTLAQAISLWRAVQTRAWRAPEDGSVPPPPRYSFAGIDHLRRMLIAHDAAWCAWFAAEGIVPLDVVYETLAEDPPAGVRCILAHVGAPPEHPVPAPRLRRQADAESLAWAERFRSER